MNIFTAPPELIGALTDLADAIAAVIFIALIGKKSGVRVKLWKILMLSLAASGLLGFFVHGFAFVAPAKNYVWVVLSLLLCVTVSLFLLCALCALCGTEKIKKYALYVGIAGGAVYAAMMIASVFYKGYLMIFIVYAIICLVSALAVFVYLYFKTKSPAYALYSLAMIIQIPGGVVQTRRDLVLWNFLDYNGIYHILLLISVVLLYFGFAKEGKHNKNA